MRILKILSLITVATLLATVPGLSQPIVTVTDLGTFGGDYGGMKVEPTAINNLGQVVGAISLSPAPGWPHAVLWTAFWSVCTC